MAVLDAPSRYPTTRPQRKKPLAERFWAKVEKTPTCWNWTASTRRDGYGWFNVNNGAQLAHRVSYELCKGPIEDGLHVLHSCDNPACVNPNHLSLGTHQDNMDEKVARGRSTAGRHIKPFCKRNHEFTGANLYMYRGNRYCRACRAERRNKTNKPQIPNHE
ncbi:HNH endonuclease signature motif containing protein [Hymenobacter koreensis]|uniref:HNH endonuclease signature motif containing protein n=1 Tax=Hymenobacter koreensis TaxID=1084523 RepID=UPI003CD08EF5